MKQYEMLTCWTSTSSLLNQIHLLGEFIRTCFLNENIDLKEATGRLTVFTSLSNCIMFMYSSVDEATSVKILSL